MNIRRALREPLTARAFREFLYSILGVPVAYLSFGAVLATCFLTGVSVVVVVAPVLAMILALDRRIAALYRVLARRLLRLEIAKPARPARQPGLLGFLVYHLADPVAWRAVGYFAVSIPLRAVEGFAAFFFWVEGVILAFNPLLWRIEPSHTVDAQDQTVTGIAFGHFVVDTWPRSFLVAAVGLLVVLAAPWVVRGPLYLDRWLLVRLLGPSDSSQRIRELEQTRSNAINEAALTLRRIERDLHDGAQARLVALGMRLGRAESRLDKGEPEQAKVLLQESRAEVKEIIGELRELVRGIHPPALDAGLEAALTTLAARSQIPATVRVNLAGVGRPPASTETMLYFAAAELLANAGKHSRATEASIGVACDGATLRLTVADNGVGGATLSGPGSGLRGLAERVRTLDGSLAAESPAGGPTIITIDLPAQDFLSDQAP